MLLRPLRFRHLATVSLVLTGLSSSGTTKVCLAVDAPLVPPDRLAWHLPDLRTAQASTMQSIEQAVQVGDEDQAAYHKRLLSAIESVIRSVHVELTLEETIRRTLANNYTIETLSYNPAVANTRTIEAEAAFDALLFSNFSKRNVDQPTASQLFAADADFTTFEAGLQKRLSAGTVITGQYSLDRIKQSFAFQDPRFNPAYTSDFSLSLRQPLLRGFGIDVNRSTIVIARNNRQISDYQFQRQVEDILLEVESRYWALVQARRNVVITAREVADFEEIYQYLLARKDFDILPVNLFATQADLEQAKVDFVKAQAAVFDAEDELIALMNDPDINLVNAVELVPRDFPHIEPVAIDRAAEIQAALENRTELKERELNVSNLKVRLDNARNAELPALDLTFTTTTTGLGGSADRSFDEVTRRDFITYDVGLRFELPVGNRASRAARRRAELQHAQGVAGLRDMFEDVILEVNGAIRKLETSYDQIVPSLAWVEASERELRSRVARAERKDYGELTAELGARRQLAASRRALLRTLVDYNLAIVELEDRKGTLLPYSSVAIPTDED